MVKKIIFGIIVFCLLFMTVKFFYFNRKIMDFCDHAVGVSLEDIRIKSIDNNFRISNLDDNGKVLIHSTANFGRGVCILNVKNGYVASSLFDFD